MKTPRKFPLPTGALPLPYPQTPSSAAQLIKLEGLCMAEISRTTGISRTTFHNLLSGRAKGGYGKTHYAAVLLGLKPPPRQRRALAQERAAA